MKTVEMTVVNDIYLGTPELSVEEYATNKDGSGLFLRKDDGTFEQLAGTGQFHARSPAILARKIRAWIGAEKGAKMVRGSARNWGVK